MLKSSPGDKSHQSAGQAFPKEKLHCQPSPGRLDNGNEYSVNAGALITGAQVLRQYRHGHMVCADNDPPASCTEKHGRLF